MGPTLRIGWPPAEVVGGRRGRRHKSPTTHVACSIDTHLRTRVRLPAPPLFPLDFSWVLFGPSLLVPIGCPKFGRRTRKELQRLGRLGKRALPFRIPEVVGAYPESGGLVLGRVHIQEHAQPTCRRRSRASSCTAISSGRTSSSVWTLRAASWSVASAERSGVRAATLYGELPVHPASGSAFRDPS
jgi:hypothetical protein